MAEPPITPVRFIHTWTTSLDGRAVRSMLQAALYTADTILLPASAAVAAGPGSPDRDFTLRQLHRLRDLGAIQLWTVEGMSSELARALGMTALHCLSADQYREIYGRAVDRLVTQRKLFLGRAVLNVDGITEIVLGKQALIHAELATALGADAILHDRDSARGYGQFLSDLHNPIGLTNAIAEALALELDLPDASSLPDEVLERSRARLSAFRSYLIDRLRQHSPILIGDSALDDLKTAVVRDVVGEYHEYLAKRSRDHAMAHHARDVWRIKRIGGRPEPAFKGNDIPLQMLFELRASGHRNSERQPTETS